MALNSEESIRRRAYAIWEDEGHPEGRSLEHWLRAEAELVKSGVFGVTDDGKPAGPSRAAQGRSRSKAAPAAPPA